MKLRSAALAVLLTFLSTNSYGANTWSAPFLIDEIRTTSLGVFIIPQSTLPSPCTAFRFYNGYNSATWDMIKITIPMLLTAVATGREITVRYDDATSSCYLANVSLFD